MAAKEEDACHFRGYLCLYMGIGDGINGFWEKIWMLGDGRGEMRGSKKVI